MKVEDISLEDIKNLEIGNKIKLDTPKGEYEIERYNNNYRKIIPEEDKLNPIMKYDTRFDEWYSEVMGIDNKIPENTTPEVKKETKEPTKKSQKGKMNNLIRDTWSDIGDEGDWDWYKKMKKKDVITYLEDQVLDEFSDARKRGYDYGLEWSEVQKKIKKYVNDKMK